MGAKQPEHTTEATVTNSVQILKIKKKKKKKTISSGSGTNEKISKYGNLSTPPLTLPPFKGCNFNRFSFEVVALMPTHTKALAVSL